MTFKQAKVIIRTALAEASPEKLVEVLDAGRAGDLLYGGPVFTCSCLSERLHGRMSSKTHEVHASST